MIVGITGTNRAGKGNLVEALKLAGFKHYSAREFIKEKSTSKSRDDLIAVANALRAKHGPAYIAETLFKRAKKHKGHAVIESLRNPGEIEALRTLGEFYLIGVNAPVKKRYARAVAQGTLTDKVTFEKFVTQEEAEMHSEDKFAQNISVCMENADYFFWSDYENPEVARQHFMFGKDAFLNLFPKKNRRVPSFNELFMRRALEISDRSKCLRRSVGAVISKEKTIISDGYNGPVRNAPHCQEVGCKRAQLNVPSGERQELCRGAHAEANAIINAGRNDHNVVGATLHSTTYPCSFCARDIVNSGIEKVFYIGAYADELSEDLLREGEVKITPYHGVSPNAYPKFWS